MYIYLIKFCGGRGFCILLYFPLIFFPFLSLNFNCYSIITIILSSNSQTASFIDFKQNILPRFFTIFQHLLLIFQLFFLYFLAPYIFSANILFIFYPPFHHNVQKHRVKHNFRTHTFTNFFPSFMFSSFIFFSFIFYVFFRRFYRLRNFHGY